MVGAVRNRGKKNILYPMFLECVKYTNDEFWISLYEDLAIGRYPKGIYISGDCIYTGNKWKSDGYKFKNKSPKTLTNELHDFIIQNTNIYSNVDISNRKNEIDDIKQLINKRGKDKSDTKEIKFNQIKKKNERDLLIFNYVLKIKNDKKLSWNEARNMLNTIELGFLTHTLTAKHIQLNTEHTKNKKRKREMREIIKIKEIHGLEFDEDNRTWNIINDSNFNEEKIILDHFYMIDRWNIKYKDRKKTKKSDIEE